MTVLEKIKEVMSNEIPGTDFDNVDMDTTFEELELDSLDLLTVVMAIEETFDIEISEEDGDNMKCIGDAVSYVESKIG
jgi:acyl carrier protein